MHGSRFGFVLALVEKLELVERAADVIPIRRTRLSDDLIQGTRRTGLAFPTGGIARSHEVTSRTWLGGGGQRLPRQEYGDHEQSVLAKRGS